MEKLMIWKGNKRRQRGSLMGWNMGFPDQRARFKPWHHLVP